MSACYRDWRFNGRPRRNEGNRKRKGAKKKEIADRHRPGESKTKRVTWAEHPDEKAKEWEYGREGKERLLNQENQPRGQAQKKNKQKARTGAAEAAAETEAERLV